MARAQKSYMEGSTSPSNLIQTACFLLSAVLAAVSRLAESVAVLIAESVAVMALAEVSAVAVSCVVPAKPNAASIIRTEKTLVSNFMALIYEVLGAKSVVFGEISGF